MKKFLSLLGCCCAFAFLAAGCSDQSKDAYDAAGKDLKSAAQETGKALKEDTRKAGEELKAKTKDMGPDLSKATANTKAALDNDKMSLTITNAIGERKDFTVKDLKVDTNGTKITLHGSVSSAAQKQLAEKVAKDTCGPGCTVDDQLSTK